MKEGAGEDPFAESPADADSDGSVGRSEAGTDDTGTPEVRIPYKFRRDSVQTGRDRVPLFLHAETKTAERDAQRELEERFGEDVSLTDLREALMKAGLAHLDDAATELESWGYGMTFEE